MRAPRVQDIDELISALMSINLVPAQRDELGDAQPMTIGDEDQRAIARTVAAELAGGLQELFDLIGG